MRMQQASCPAHSHHGGRWGHASFMNRGQFGCVITLISLLRTLSATWFHLIQSATANLSWGIKKRKNPSFVIEVHRWSLYLYSAFLKRFCLWWFMNWNLGKKMSSTQRWKQKITSMMYERQQSVILKMYLAHSIPASFWRPSLCRSPPACLLACLPPCREGHPPCSYGLHRRTLSQNMILPFNKGAWLALVRTSLLELLMTRPRCI